MGVIEKWSESLSNTEEVAPHWDLYPIAPLPPHRTPTTCFLEIVIKEAET